MSPKYSLYSQLGPPLIGLLLTSILQVIQVVVVELVGLPNEA